MTPDQDVYEKKSLPGIIAKNQNPEGKRKMLKQPYKKYGRDLFS